MSLNATLPAALAGAADTAYFLVRRPRLFREAPGRAAGSVVFLTGWLGLAAAAARGDRGRGVTTTLAGALLAGNAAMLAVHLRHRIANPRVFAGTALSAVALAASAKG